MALDHGSGRMLRSRDKLFYTWIFRVPRQVVPLPFGLAWYGKGVLTVAWQRLRIKVQKGNSRDHVMIVMARSVRLHSPKLGGCRVYFIARLRKTMKK
jgi:hypothetical protein